MVYQTIDQIISKAKTASRQARLAVAAAQESHTLEAVLRAKEEGVIAPVLVGDADRIRDLLLELGADLSGFRICDASAEETPGLAVRLIREGEADFLMKGNLHTSAFLKAVLNKETGLMKRPQLSHLAITQMPAYHKLIAISDSAIATSPDVDAKSAIMENALDALHALGYDNPKVAVLTAVEMVNPKMQETVDADELKQRWLKGAYPNCVVEGPISVDLAFDKEAAAIKGFASEVVGDPDLLLMPNIAAGNIMLKSLKLFASATTIGIALGASVPVVLTSRGTSVNGKYYSIALGAALATGG